ncbi:MAG TPA: SBBP repeat-containing protein, partial [Armatimonadota bacterium]
TNYYRGTRAITGVPNYAMVAWKGVYTGIDLVCYGQEAGLEYDFNVAPKTSIDGICMTFDGIDSLELAPSGDLLVHFAPGVTLPIPPPASYQTASNGLRAMVSSGFRLLGPKSIGFTVGAYDTTKPLTIDPVLRFSTYLGGTNYDNGNGIAADAAGNAYVTGYTLSTDFPTVRGYQSSNQGNFDAFLTKIDTKHSQVMYSTYFGGTDSDQGNRVVQAEGKAYIVGSTNSPDFPIKRAVQSTFGGEADAFVAGFDYSGRLLFSTYYGGSGNDLGYDLTRDALGNLYLTGATDSGDFPLKRAYQAQKFTGFDAFLVKLAYPLDLCGSICFATYFGGDQDDEGYGIGVDALGNITIGGETFSDDLPTNPGAFQPDPGGGQDGFVAKFNTQGNRLLYASYLGGDERDVVNDLTVDALGCAYLIGSTDSQGLATPGALQETMTGYMNAFVARITPTGSALLYCTYLGGTAYEVGTSIAVDLCGNAYVIGYTDSADFPLVNPLPGQDTQQGGYDAFISKLNPRGSALLFSTYLGGDNDDYGNGIALPHNNNLPSLFPLPDIYVVGTTNSDTFPTVNPTQGFMDCGATDAFVSVISQRN